MSNLSKELIDKLKKDLYFNSIEIIEVQESDLVKKFLFKLEDNNHIEMSKKINKLPLNYFDKSSKATIAYKNLALEVISNGTFTKTK